MKKKGIYAIICIIAIITISLSMNRYYSKFLSSGTITGTTVIPAKDFDVNLTYKYKYVDELGNEVEFKNSTTEVRSFGDVITLDEVVENSFESLLSKV